MPIKRFKNSNMPARVPEIPIEALSRIFSFVENKKTLRNLMLSSKNFQKIATPHLYSHLEFLDSDFDHGFDAFRPLTCLFLRKPELARNVRHLALRGSFDDGAGGYGKGQKIELDPEIRSAIVASSQSKEEEAQWLEDASDQSNEDSILSLLLPTLTNLRSFDVEMPLSPRYVPRQLERIGRRQHPFDKNPSLTMLTDIMIAHRDNKYGLYTDSIGCAFYLPAIKNLYLHRIGSADGSDPAEETADPLKNIEDGSSSVTSIDMHDCKLSPGDFASFMRAPKALTSFCYELGWGHLSYTSYKFPQMREELERHKSTLRDLWIDYVVDGIEWLSDSSDMDVTTPMRSFADFTALKRVTFAMVFLFGEEPEESTENENRLVEALPPQVEYVKLTHTEDGPDVAIAALETLVVQKAGKFPELKHVEIECCPEDVDDRIKRFQKLKQLAENEKGLNFVVRHSPVDSEPDADSKRVERKWGFDEDVEWKTCNSDCNARVVFEVRDLGI